VAQRLTPVRAASASRTGSPITVDQGASAAPPASPYNQLPLALSLNSADAHGEQRCRRPAPRSLLKLRQALASRQTSSRSDLLLLLTASGRRQALKPPSSPPNTLAENFNTGNQTGAPLSAGTESSRHRCGQPSPLSPATAEHASPGCGNALLNTSSRLPKAPRHPGARNIPSRHTANGNHAADDRDDYPNDRPVYHAWPSTPAR
jgi:hypothetical protein